MAGRIVKGAAAGAALGTAVPVVGNVVGAIGGAVIGAVTGLFTSKKHYHLYYWDTVESVWKFVMDGHPSSVNPQAKAYEKAGVVVAIVRNEGDKHADGTLAPKSPPAGYSAAPAASGAQAGLNPWIFAGIGGAGLLLFFLLRRKGRG